MERQIVSRKELEKSITDELQRRSGVDDFSVEDQRPAEIDQRQEVGHWEADLLIFKRINGKGWNSIDKCDSVGFAEAYSLRYCARAMPSP